MALMIIQHPVADYNTWRIAYNAAETIRARHGCTGERVLRACDDNTQLTILHEFPTTEAAQSFAADPDLPKAMEAGGVQGPPDIAFTTDA
ncbi:MAG: cyclase [Acidimicrobiales bacterium]